jgi:hypothetical protein
MLAEIDIPSVVLAAIGVLALVGSLLAWGFKYATLPGRVDGHDIRLDELEKDRERITIIQQKVLEHDNILRSISEGSNRNESKMNEQTQLLYTMKGMMMKGERWDNRQERVLDRDEDVSGDHSSEAES